ncbi:hypothetical protein Tco_1450829 [Tanacetum coccineum]
MGLVKQEEKHMCWVEETLTPVQTLSRFRRHHRNGWLANHHTVIVCDEKIMRIPYGDEVLIVQGNRGGKGEKLKLSIISCTKTQKYIKRGCPIFLAQVMRKESKNKSEEKRLEDVWNGYLRKGQKTKPKPDTEWKSVEKTKSRQSPSVKKSTKVNPDKSKVKK